MEILLPLQLKSDAKLEVVEGQAGTSKAANGMNVSELTTSADTAMVPLVGRIAAGGPILADQAVEDILPLPRQLVGHGELFMLKVTGDSMIDAAICDGDWVVVAAANRRRTTATSLPHCSRTKPR